jgi:putative heme degradation protein
MTEAVWVALIVGVPSTIAATTGAVVAIVGLARGNKTGKDIERQGVVQQEQGEVQKEIHVAVNSNMAAAVATIAEGKAALQSAVSEVSALKQSAVSAVADASAAAMTEMKNQMTQLRSELAARDSKYENGNPPPRRRRP